MKSRLIILGTMSSALFAQDATQELINRANRRIDAKTVCVTTANEKIKQPLVDQPRNGDEQRYADLRGSYGKALETQSNGFVSPGAFRQMVTALENGTSRGFLNISMGTSPVERKLVSPQAAFIRNLLGVDPWIHTMPAPPAVASAEKAGEMVEVYWHPLLRDVHFSNYNMGTVGSAVNDLNKLSDFRGPKIGGVVTPATLFRANVPGTLNGPFVSQFLYLPVTFSDTTFEQQYNVPMAISANEFMATFTEWLFIQQGHNPVRSIAFDPTPRYFRNMRDLGNFVHGDPPQLPYLYALLILTKFGNDALDRNNPYLGNPTQEPFAEFFKPQFASLLSYAVECALQAAWYQKWMIHRTCRPEFFGFLVDGQKNGTNYGLHPDIINSDAVTQIFTFNQGISGTGNYLLPQAFPEGSPTHPTYPQGHSTVAGAAVTMLKAFFDENYVIQNPQVANADGTALTDYIGDTLTVGGELNKLAGNMAFARDFAGVHYRSDGEAGLRLGEAVAIGILEDFSYLFNIDFRGFSLTKFDGTTITIGGKKSFPQVGR